jgi:hypothetical protein
MGEGGMTFEELLDQTIDMLRRRGRVTYRALKLHFHLDDEASIRGSATWPP